MLPLRCLFAFHDAAGSLLEIKRLDQPAGSSPISRKRWPQPLTPLADSTPLRHDAANLPGARHVHLAAVHFS